MDAKKIIQGGVRAWIPFGDDVEIEMEYIARDELQRLARDAKRVFYDSKHRRQEEFDPGKFDQLLGRRVVKNWNGFTMDEAPWPYSPENCDILISKYNEFARFVNDMADNLSEFQDAEKKRKEKNSESTFAPGSIIQK